MDPPPTIHELAWGAVTTAVGTFRDAKLWPGGGRNWDWRETGTQHRPGIQAADLDEVLEHRPAVVILGRGQQGRLEVTDEAYAAVAAAGATVEVLLTEAAVARYNRLAGDGVAVGALIHSTC